jgi:hypothetical protein
VTYEGIDDWLKNDELFRKKLQEGWATEVYAENRLRSHGIDVKRDDEERDITKHDHDRRAEYKNQIDLIINEKDYLEVKGRKLKFTDDPKTFPSYFPTAIVMSVSSWNGHNPKRTMVIYVSNITGGILGIPCDEESRKHWIEDWVFDTERKIKDKAFLCPRQYLISFDDIVERLGGKPKNLVIEDYFS